MDNLCHTLVGAALGEAGLKRKSPLATATLLIGANLPDIDVLAVPFGHGLDFRRGLTHGIPALIVLPFVLTALMLAWDRFVRRRRHPDAAPAQPAPLLLLSALSILTHPVLDYMNDYGMRWLMPFADRWFYGDALFIIDPWMWVVLGAGVFVTRRLHRRGTPSLRLARWAVGLTTTYVAVMLILSFAGRYIVRTELEALGFTKAQSLMVGPLPITPLHKRVVFLDGDAYRFGSLSWLPTPHLTLQDRILTRQSEHPAARAAAATPEGAIFLRWSRFPFFVIEQTDDATLVRLDDARYSLGGQPSWAAVTVKIE